jgi:uncharacterized SAM-dependent methyltransferase
MNVHAAALANAQRFDEQTTAFAGDVIDGLSQHPKRLSPKYFYDAAGSELFEQITLLPEYYPTRTELSILRDRGSEISAGIPDGAALVEFGAGATTKVRLLLRECAFGAYIPVDISGVSTSIRSRRILPRRSHCPRLSARCRRSGFSRDRRSEISSRMKPAVSCAAPATFWARTRSW